MEVRGIQLVISSLEERQGLGQGNGLAHKDHTGRIRPEGCGGRAGETK